MRPTLLEENPHIVPHIGEIDILRIGLKRLDGTFDLLFSVCRLLLLALKHRLLKGLELLLHLSDRGVL